MTLFEKYYGKSDKELTEDMKELTYKKLVRGFGSTIDQLEGEKISIEARVVNLRMAIANGNNSYIIALGQALIELEDLDNLVDVLEEEQKEFVGTTD